MISMTKARRQHCSRRRETVSRMSSPVDRSAPSGERKPPENSLETAGTDLAVGYSNLDVFLGGGMPTWCRAVRLRVLAVVAGLSWIAFGGIAVAEEEPPRVRGEKVDVELKIVPFYAVDAQ